MGDADGTEPIDGRSTRWVSHRRERRAALVAQAEDVLASSGPGVAMDELASAMGTSKSILYRYFEDRRGIRDALAEAAVGRMHRALVDIELRGIPEDPRQAELEVFFREVAAHPGVYLFILAVAIDPAEPIPATGLGSDEADSLLAHCPLETTALSSLDEGFAALPYPRRATAVGAVRGATMQWLGRRTARTGTECAELAADVAGWLTDGLLPPAQG